MEKLDVDTLRGSPLKSISQPGDCRGSGLDGDGGVMASSEAGSAQVCGRSFGGDVAVASAGRTVGEVLGSSERQEPGSCAVVPGPAVGVGRGF